jgi:hypothetical protein
MTTSPKSLLTDCVAQISTASTELLTQAIQDLQRELESRTDANWIFSAWHVDDVLSERPDLTEEQCREVLRNLERNHDANIGINWEVIDTVAAILYPAPDNLAEQREEAS